jgi:hypothetical protein
MEDIGVGLQQVGELAFDHGCGVEKVEGGVLGDEEGFHGLVATESPEIIVTEEKHLYR